MQTAKRATMNSCFIYSWHIDEHQKDVTSIRAYALDNDNKNVCLRIDDFTPYIYLELPSYINWNASKAQVVLNKINEIMGKFKPLKSSLVMKKKLYYAHLNEEGQHKKFPYLHLHFSSKSDIAMLFAKTKNGLSVSQIGIVKVKMHEQKASPVLQLICNQGIPTTGWIKFKGTPVGLDDRLTSCDFEYKVSSKNMLPSDSESVVCPLVMSYDIEVYSSNPNKMPTKSNPRDKVFQMSCVFFRVGDKEEKYDRYLFSLGEPNSEGVGAGVSVYACHNEAELLEAYTNIINEKQPNIICGYNIFKFDIPYMLARAKTVCNVLNLFDKQGFDKYGHATEKTIKWSSSAYKNQEFSYLDAEGRIFVDLLPLIQRDYKMSSYTLKAVSEKFIGDTKDPLNHKGIFKCFVVGMEGGHKGAKALALVGKYCVQDSVLVAKLFDKLLIWFGLSEMAKICNVSIFTLYTQGQQIKVYSQVYKKCLAEGIIVESDGYTPKEDEHYQGAYVFEPVPGVYDCVVPFDFASLYPSIMIAHNIDFTSLVPTETSIPDDMCNIIEWTEHVGCAHDETIRKTKPKHILCGHRKFRFLKTIKGVLPSLQEDLLGARKKTRTTIKEIKEKLKSCTCPNEKLNLETTYNVLDKRQLSYKVSSNSMYGALGVQAGYLPLMPGAMCITELGRRSILKVASVITGQYGARIILGDTDSVYCVFDQFTDGGGPDGGGRDGGGPDKGGPDGGGRDGGRVDTRALWAHCEKASDEISKLFQKPMKLEFEGVIYLRLLTLTKKRYMALKCDKDGVAEVKVDKKTGIAAREIEKKGVLLTRRDNSNFVRTVYADVIMKIFDKKDKNEILYTIIQYFNNLYANTFAKQDFIITKSVGAATINEAGKVVVVSLSKTQGMVGDYKVPLLAEEGTNKREHQFNLKKADNENDYYMRCLPSQVQLAAKMRRRGQRVDAGSRLEFVVLTPQGIDSKKAKLYTKLESFDYYKEHSSVLEIDKLYYLTAIATQLDRVLVCTIGVRDFGKTQMKLRAQKDKVLKQLKGLFEPGLIIEEDPVFVFEE